MRLSRCSGEEPDQITFIYMKTHSFKLYVNLSYSQLFIIISNVISNRISYNSYFTSLEGMWREGDDINKKTSI